MLGSSVVARTLSLSLGLSGLTAPAALADVQLPAGKPLDRELVQEMLAASLAASEPDGPVAITIDHPNLPLANRASRPITLSVAALERDASGQRYAASLAATLPDGTTTSIRVSGTIERLIDVPVLSRPIAAGEVIRATDITWKKVTEARQQPGTLFDMDALVGFEARRPLPADRALRARDVKAPLLVQRGEAVSVLFGVGGLEITALGTALGSGSLGEAVQVQNAGSGEIRRGVVEAPRRVRVGSLASHP